MAHGGHGASALIAHRRIDDTSRVPRLRLDDDLVPLAIWLSLLVLSAVVAIGYYLFR
jgi:hypothetical protein